MGTTVLDQRIIFEDSNMYHLGDFNPHAYDSESIKMVNQVASKARIEYKHAITCVSVSATKVKAIKNVRGGGWE